MSEAITPTAASDAASSSLGRKLDPANERPVLDQAVPHMKRRDVESPAGDLNEMLAREQSSIMRADSVECGPTRSAHERDALFYRNLIEQTPYPAHTPVDFDALRSPTSSMASELSREALEREVAAMERSFIKRLADGAMGTKHNTFQHQARMVRQARQRLRP